MQVSLYYLLTLIKWILREPDTVFSRCCSRHFTGSSVQKIIRLWKNDLYARRIEMQENHDTEINLFELLGSLLSHWFMILLSGILAAVIGFAAVQNLLEPQYEATVNMIVNTRQDHTGAVTNDNITSAQRLADTYSIILKSDLILDEVIEKLGLSMSYEELQDRMRVQSVNGTQVMRISLRDPDPVRAKKIVSVLSSLAPDRLVEAVEAGSCKVISKVLVSPEPVFPSKLWTLALSGFAGVVLASIFFVVRFFMRNYIEDDEDVQKYLDLPVLGVIPEIKERDLK